MANSCSYPAKVCVLQMSGNPFWMHEWTQSHVNQRLDEWLISMTNIWPLRHHFSFDLTGESFSDANDYAAGVANYQMALEGGKESNFQSAVLQSSRVNVAKYFEGHQSHLESSYQRMSDVRCAIINNIFALLAFVTSISTSSSRFVRWEGRNFILFVRDDRFLKIFSVHIERMFSVFYFFALSEVLWEEKVFSFGKKIRIKAAVQQNGLVGFWSRSAGWLKALAYDLCKYRQLRHAHEVGLAD